MIEGHSSLAFKGLVRRQVRVVRVTADQTGGHVDSFAVDHGLGHIGDDLVVPHGRNFDLPLRRVYRLGEGEFKRREGRLVFKDHLFLGPVRQGHTFVRSTSFSHKDKVLFGHSLHLLRLEIRALLLLSFVI